MALACIQPPEDHGCCRLGKLSKGEVAQITFTGTVLACQREFIKALQNAIPPMQRHPVFPPLDTCDMSTVMEEIGEPAIVADWCAVAQRVMHNSPRPYFLT